VPSDRLEDRIRELCAQALASGDDDLPEVMAQLRFAIRQHIEGVRERMRELAAKIATEHDHGKFTALVQEFNQMLDGEQAAELPRNGEGG
jgi:hypothetical protein